MDELFAWTLLEVTTKPIELIVAGACLKDLIRKISVAET